MNLSKKYGNDRLVKACQRSVGFGIYNYRIIKKILESGLDTHGDDESTDGPEMPPHDNIRGSDYYK